MRIKIKPLSIEGNGKKFVRNEILYPVAIVYDKEKDGKQKDLYYLVNIDDVEYLINTIHCTVEN